METIKRTFKRNILALGCILVFACETDVTDDIDLASSPPKLVIQGGLERNVTSPLPQQQIRLTTTNDFLSDEPNPAITEALVSITDGTTVWIMDHQGNGIYSNSDLSPQIGVTYTMTIVWDGETYQGSDTLNEVPPFDRFFTEFEEGTIFSPEGYFLKFDTTDPANIENYYYYRAFRNGEFVIVPDPGNAQILIASDEFSDGQQIIGADINGEVPFQVGERATGQQLGISEEYFNYLFQLFTQTGNTGINFGGNPPPATIRSNIINLDTPSRRAVGFFYTADVEEDTLTITE
ncbi:MAG: DUF4249 domain-containing protein [Bacteroidota bacterium]